MDYTRYKVGLKVFHSRGSGERTGWRSERALITGWMRGTGVKQVPGFSAFDQRAFDIVDQHKGRCYSIARGEVSIYDAKTLMMFKLALAEHMTFVREETLVQPLYPIAPGLFKRLRKHSTQ